MLSLFTIWQSFQGLVNTAQNSFFRPQTDFQQSVNDISKELWETWTSMAEKSQQIRDHLAPFLKSKNIVVSPRNSYYGMADYPKNYGRFADARVWSIGDECVQCPESEGADQKEVDEKYYASIKESQCDLVDEKRWTACLSHLTKAPTLEKPKITQIDGGWKVAPRTVSILVLDYYIRPTDGTFKYTIVAGNPQTGAGDFIQYDQTSTPLEWPETVINYFLWKLSLRYSVFIGNQFLAQFSQQQSTPV